MTSTPEKQLQNIENPSRLLHYFVLLILGLNLFHLLLLSHFNYNLYDNTHPSKIDGFWSPNSLIHLFIQPLFRSPLYTLYSLVILITFWFVGREMLQRMGGWRFSLFYILTGLGVVLCHNLWNPNKRLYGMAGPLFGLMALSWWYYPTRWVFDRIKLRLLMFQGALLLMVFSLFLMGTSLDTLSPLTGFCWGILFFQIESLLQRGLRRYREKRMTHMMERETWIRQRVDELLEKIGKGGMESLSREEKKFLNYASRYYRHVLEKGGKEADPAITSKKTRPPRTPI